MQRRALPRELSSRTEHRPSIDRRLIPFTDQGAQRSTGGEPRHRGRMRETEALDFASADPYGV